LIIFLMEFLTTKINQISFSSNTLGLKIKKSLPLNHNNHGGLSNNTMCVPQLLWIFLFWFYWILMRICSIFNNFCTIGLYIMKPHQCTPTHWELISNLTEIVARSIAIWELISMWPNKFTHNFFWHVVANLLHYLKILHITKNLNAWTHQGDILNTKRSYF